MVVADQFLMGSTNVEMENEKDSAKEEALVKEIGGTQNKKEIEGGGDDRDGEHCCYKSNRLRSWDRS